MINGGALSPFADAQFENISSESLMQKIENWESSFSTSDSSFPIILKNLCSIFGLNEMQQIS